MAKQIKKIMSTFLLSVLLIGVLPIVVLAEGGGASFVARIGEKEYATLEKKYNDIDASYKWEVFSNLALKNSLKMLLISSLMFFPPFTKIIKDKQFDSQPLYFQ